MTELDEAYDLLQSGARSVGAEVSSPWFYLQLGLILAGAGIAFGAGAAVRSRVDMTSLAMGWPAPLRLAMVGTQPGACSRPVASPTLRRSGRGEVVAMASALRL